MTDNKLYKSEMKNLRSRHNLYAPQLKKLLYYYSNPHFTEGPIEFTKINDMLLICELLDIGYIENNAISVHKKEDALFKVVYNKRYPLTEQGEVLVHGISQRSTNFIKFLNWKVIIITLFAIFAFLICYLLFKTT